MPRLSFYVSDKIEMQLRIRAERAKLPLSTFLAELIKREANLHNEWPAGYFELFDKWQGESQTGPAESAK